MYIFGKIKYMNDNKEIKSVCAKNYNLKYKCTQKRI